MVKYKQYFVSGIGTDVGKTVASAVLVQALKASYWKPIQAGNLEKTDSDFIRNYTDFGSIVLDEAFRLSMAASPNIAAKNESKVIRIQDIIVPILKNNLIIEGAGGIMVPINDKSSIIDFIKATQLSVILCVKSYLGCINHLLLSIEVLKLHHIPIVGLILSGTFDSNVLDTIFEFSKLPIIAQIPLTDNLSKEFIREQAALINLNLL